jgi:Tol biopolymer transport system component
MRPTIRTIAPLAALLLAGAEGRLIAQASGNAIRKIAAIDPSQWYGFAEPASGRFVVYANGTGIHIINPQSGKVTSTIDHAVAPVRQSYFGGSLSISASGRRLAFLATGETKDTAHVWTVDLDTMSGRAVSTPHRVSLMPSDGFGMSDDGRWIALVTIDPKATDPQKKLNLVVIPSDGGDARKLDVAGRIQMPRWTPDGKTIFYIRGRGKGPALVRVAAAGGTPDSLAPAAAAFGVSADGKLVAYVPPTVGERVPLRIADLQGREVGSLPLLTTDFFNAWSRHEPATMLGTRQLNPTSLKVVSLDNGKLQSSPLVDHASHRPSFSPDGRRVAMVSLVDDQLQLVVFDVATSQRRVVRTAIEPDVSSLQWSPDGARMAFLALDSSMTRHELYAIDLSTSRTTRLADLGPARRGNTVLYRWHSDGKSIDFITGTDPHGAPTASVALERVALDGTRSLVRKLPSVPHGSGTDGGYRLLNDTLIAIGRDYSPTGKDSSYLKIIDTRTGETRAFIDRFAYWLKGQPASILSPDGKWVAFGSGGMKDNKIHPQWAIASIDGKTVRLLGEPMLCDAWPDEWLPDSKALFARGAASCDDWRPETYIVPIDGGPARHIDVPLDRGGPALAHDGRSLLVSVLEPMSITLMSLDVRKALGAQAAQAGAPVRKSGNQ